MLPRRYDRNKTVVVLAKGANAFFIPSSEDYYVACLNSSGRLAEKIDFQFFNDGLSYRSVSKYVTGFQNLIVPPRFVDVRGYKSSDEFVHKECGEWVCESRYYLGQKGDKADMPDVRSTGESAIFWLLEQGFRTFILCGMDPGGGYHKIFREEYDKADYVDKSLSFEVACPNAFYEIQFNRIKSRLRRAGASWVRSEKGATITKLQQDLEEKVLKAESPLATVDFDKWFYLATNITLLESALAGNLRNPKNHFVTVGMAKGLPGVPFGSHLDFDEEWYIEQYPDVKELIIKDLHYISLARRHVLYCINS